MAIFKKGLERMLDTSVTLINVNYNRTQPFKQTSGLILSGCRVTLSGNTTYSEIDELNFYDLNCNDYGFGRVDIELTFENIFSDPYFKFYISCVSIRSDGKTICKINRNHISKIFLNDNYTKLTKDSKLALGLSYYFKSQEEQNLLVCCNSFCVEGFVAFKKKKNNYGFVVRVEKKDNIWTLVDGNTYRIYKNININSLCH